MVQSCVVQNRIGWSRDVPSGAGRVRVELSDAEPSGAEWTGAVPSCSEPRGAEV